MTRAALALALLAWAAGARAQDADPPPSLTWRATLTASVLASRAPDAPLLFPERDGASSRWRLRIEPQARLGRGVTAVVAYEHRLRVQSATAAFAGLDALAAAARAPYRVRQLDWPVAESSGSSWRHEIDRAYVAASGSRLGLTVGRQAVGWGRGVLFGAVDLFAPFTPLEADREWRRGIDAVRADVRLADRASLDLVGALGRAVSESVFAARLRGYRGRADVEVMGGRRARDVFAGVTSSVAVGDAEAHGELAIFRTPEARPGRGRDVVKAVAGASYRIGVGEGVLVHAEYHYSGFGAKDPAALAALLADPDFRARYLRGDAQVLERHAVALLASYEASPELTLALQWLHAPAGGSGIVIPSASVTLGDKVSLLAAGYLPHGPAPRGLAPRSEYGTAPLACLLQARLHF